jgi:hypothetical protein
VVTVIVVLEPGATDVGLNVPPAPVGNPLAVNVTVFANAPPTVAVLIVNVVGEPATTVCVVGDGVTEKSVIVKLIAAVVPPPGVGVNTVIAAVPEVAMSAAVIAAVNEVALTNVVTRALPFTCATDELMKFVPVSVIVNPAPPALIVLGEIAVSVGTGFGAVIVNISEFENVPIGPPCGRILLAPPNSTSGINTWTVAVPTAAISAAVIAAVNCVALTNVVVRFPPFHCTMAVFRKLLPFTVSVNAAPPAAAELGDREVNTPTGVLTKNVWEFEVPPPGAGFNTETEKSFAV